MNEWRYEVRDSKGNLKGQRDGFSTREEARRAAALYVKNNLPPGQQFKITASK